MGDSDPRGRRSGDELGAAFAEQLLPVVRGALVTVLVAALAMATLAFALGIRRMTGVATVAAVGVAIFLVTLRWLGPNTATLGATLTLLLSALYAMFVGLGLNDVAIIILPPVVVTGSLLLHRGQYIFVGATAVVGVLAIGHLQQHHLVAPTSAVELDAGDILAPPIVIIAAMVLNSLLIEALRGSVARVAASDRNYREVFNATHEAIILHDASTGQVVDVNATMLDMYGYSRDEVLALTVADLGGARGDVDGLAGPELLARAVTEGPQVVEWLARRKDGSEFWAEVTLRESQIGGRDRVLAVVRDIGERRRMQERLRQAEKLQAVGLLAGGIAHDFNNQLSGLMGYAELLRAQAHDHATVSRYADGVLTAAIRAKDLTSQLLAFARKGPRREAAIDLHHLLEEVVGLLQRSVDPGVRIETDLQADRPRTVGDHAQLQAAILNLGLNARDAMSQGGTVTFRTRDVRLEGGPDPDLGGVLPGEYVLLEVADTGRGMDGATRQRVFEPFFTTKPMGTGMGLAAVYGTVQAHGGAVSVTSELGKGSVFRVWLPLREVQVVASAARTEPTLHLAGRRILLCEDEPVVAAAFAEMLTSLDCEVIRASDGQAGVDAYASAAQPFDAVILDLVMPRLSGAAAFREMRRINARAAVVLVSGFEAQADVEQLLGEGAAAFLRKPFRLDELLAVLRQVLPASPGQPLLNLRRPTPDGRA